MGDLIDRYAALNELENIDCSDGVGLSALKCDVVEDAISAIKALPSAQPGWIPVTEKYPEIGQIVLCSLKTRHYYGRIHVCKYRAADKYYDHSYFDWDHNGFPNVVAWMPLPKPYREGGQDNG